MPQRVLCVVEPNHYLKSDGRNPVKGAWDQSRTVKTRILLIPI